MEKLIKITKRGPHKGHTASIEAYVGPDNTWKILITCSCFASYEEKLDGSTIGDVRLYNGTDPGDWECQCISEYNKGI